MAAQRVEQEQEQKPSSRRGGKEFTEIFSWGNDKSG